MRPAGARRLDFPPFAACACGERLVAAGGGGGAQFGVRNRLVVLDPATGEELGGMDTEERLFERVFADAKGRRVLAVADCAIVLFALSPAGTLKALDSLPAAEELLVACDGRAVLVVESGARLVSYALGRTGFERRWELELGQRVVALQHLDAEGRALVLLADRAMVLSSRTRQFVQALLEGESGFAKALLARDERGSRTALLRNDRGGCRLFLLDASVPGRVELVLRRALGPVSVSSASLRGELLLLGDAEGGVRVYCLGGGLSLLASVKPHDLAVTALTLLPARPRGADESFFVWSFSLDYHARAFELCPAAIRRGKTRLLTAVVAALVLLLALLLGVIARRGSGARPAL